MHETHWGKGEAGETKQRLKGEGHLTGNHWQEGVHGVEGAPGRLRGMVSIWLAAAQGAGTGSTQMPVPCLHWLALRHLSQSCLEPAWKIHSFNPSHPTAAEGLRTP